MLVFLQLTLEVDNKYNLLAINTSLNAYNVVNGDWINDWVFHT